MENVLILKSVLQDYITKQSDTDTQILNLLIREEYKEHEVIRITRCSLSKISQVKRKLRTYLRKLGYNY